MSKYPDEYKGGGAMPGCGTLLLMFPVLFVVRLFDLVRSPFKKKGKP